MIKQSEINTFVSENYAAFMGHCEANGVDTLDAVALVNARKAFAEAHLSSPAKATKEGKGKPVTLICTGVDSEGRTVIHAQAETVTTRGRGGSQALRALADQLAWDGQCAGLDSVQVFTRGDLPGAE